MFWTWIDSHVFPLKNSEFFFQNWSFLTIVVIIVCVRGRGNNKGEKKLLIIDGEDEFNQDVFALGNNFIIEYEQFFKAYNGG